MSAQPDSATGFEHQALLYSSEATFVEGVTRFLRDGFALGEPALVVVSLEKIRALRAALGQSAAQITFADMREVGQNPARIIPLWQRFVDDNAPRGRRLRGVGEPIWAGRTPAELEECCRHEALLNVAFEDGPAWQLLCPYDARHLAPEAMAVAHQTHPRLSEGGRSRPSHHFPGVEASGAPFDSPLPLPLPDATEMAFDRDRLSWVRALVRQRATAAALPPDRVSDLVMAANEVATNSVVHGGGGGTCRVWTDSDAVYCEIEDAGHIEDPLVGRRAPGCELGSGGRGLWIANQVCDLVQIRNPPAGTTVRLHAYR